ncbi:unnamed protein product [Psylliodes chrysocephalus]|uniref:Uncharacterized protein n=1 Tax=Psylliodes chrysocephalus TaxID=3402493 RepID=A0A9P0D9M1_9CUCU|nr:unnamed protein product [Psylliodes chrysocephala]
MEEFARNDLPNIINKDEFKKYYEIFSDKPDKFKFVIGHRQIIKNISEFFQKEVNKMKYDGVRKNTTKDSSSSTSQQTRKSSCDESCDELAGEPVNLQEEGQTLFRTMKSWAQLKVDADQWLSFENNFQNVGMDIKLVKGYPNNQLYCVITCFCGSKYKLPKLSNLQLDLKCVMEDFPEFKTPDSEDTDNFQMDQNPFEDKNKNEEGLIEDARGVETFTHKEDVLDLKDYSDRIKSVDENSPYVKVQLKDKSAIIKKSSYCWLLSESNGRISNDRLKRFIVGATGNTLKVSKLKKSNSKINLKKPKQNRTKTKDIEKITSETDVEIADDASDQSESHDVNVEESSEDSMEITIGKFYAVAYDIQWYIGKVSDIVNGNKFKVKFLKSEPKSAKISLSGLSKMTPI